MDQGKEIFGQDWTKLSRTEEEEAEHQKELRKIKQERINQYGFYINTHLRVKDVVTLKVDELNGVKRHWIVTGFIVTDKDLIIRISSGAHELTIYSYEIGTGKLPE